VAPAQPPDPARAPTASPEKAPASPDAPDALLRRAQARARNLQLDEAQADYEAFFRQHPDHALEVPARLSRAELWVLREKFDAARDDLTLVVEGPGRPEDKQAAQAMLAKLPAPPPKTP
jgi:hypothetical protein